MKSKKNKLNFDFFENFGNLIDDWLPPLERLPKATQG